MEVEKRALWRRLLTYFGSVGVCEETNSQLAARFGTTKHYVSNQVSRLERDEAISVEMVRVIGSSNIRRITVS